MAQTNQPFKANRGEWSEPYVAVRILGDTKVHMADANGEPDPQAWLDVVSLIRRETKARLVEYQYDQKKTNVVISVDDRQVLTAPVTDFMKLADRLMAAILAGSGKSFAVDPAIEQMLRDFEVTSLKASSGTKSDIYLSVLDPRAGVRRNNIGFSIKSDFGKPSTLFNTAKASAAEFVISGMDEKLMEQTNRIVNAKGHVAVGERVKQMESAGCRLSYRGYRLPLKAQIPTFQENLSMLNEWFPEVWAYVLHALFSGELENYDIKSIAEMLEERNPKKLSLPEFKYTYVLKNFLYAIYCGMTASKVWDGRAEVNGGFIRVNRNGKVVAFYALDSQSFKDYLFEHCRIDIPSTGEGHGDFGSVIKEDDGTFVFRLNFSIRYQ